MAFCELDYMREALIPLSEQVLSTPCCGKAAVLVALVTDSNQVELLLTRRAENMTHHAGEVAFPGGMWEQGDHFPVVTALREAQEEVALNPHHVELLGQLPAMPTKNGTMVTPVVGSIPRGVELVASPDEIDRIFMVPLDHLLPEKRIRTDVFSTRGRDSWAPAYDFRGHEIWGLTAMVIKILLERCFGVSFERQHSVPEKIW